MAEDGVARHYSDRGYALLAKRWRGKAGEIDLICRKGDCYVFVEVKSSSCLDRAAERITRRQMDRICLAACEFCGDLPSQLLTEMRFDAALVDQVGRVKVIENAFGEN
ncbi:MAG: YraN family protein [Paracoccus sp. (in: a-proteobacteria)]|nr:YraN family protein [Paracoccus sp. (in: a-proteobacteria)]